MRAINIKDIPNYTYQDYIHWEGKWEIIDGIAYAMAPAPELKHQWISSRINWILQESLKDCEHCYALLPVDWKIKDNTIVQPDNLVICYKPRGKYIIKAPSMIFEVLSPSTALKDMNLKFNLYEQEGVKYYIIVDYDDEVARVYHLQNGRYIKLVDATDETIEFDLEKCQIEFDFSKIW